MRRVVIAGSEAAKSHFSTGGRFSDTLLVTLTYRPGAKWAPEQIRQYISGVRDWSRTIRARLRYQWVIELTKRGIPHYHILWWVPHGVRLPKPDESGLWPYGFSRIEKARNAVGYLVKYATKGDTSVYAMPKGARLFGVGGGLESEKLATHRAGLPMWLLQHLAGHAGARKVARVGWVCKLTGEVFRSPFVVDWWRDEFGVVVVRVFKNVEVVSHGIASEDRGRDDQYAEFPRERGEGGIPSEIADWDFALWEVRLSAEYSAWCGSGTVRAG
jgi:hypothetical protein